MSLKKIYSSIRLINDKLPTQFLTKENITECDFLFDNLEEIPHISLLGQSGHGKSSLINAILDCKLLETGSGDGAVTQYPIELKYDDTIRYELFFDKDLNTENISLQEIWKIENNCSNYFDEIVNYKEDILKKIKEHCEELKKRNIDQFYNKGKDKFLGTKFFKSLEGSLESVKEFEKKEKGKMKTKKIKKNYHFSMTIDMKEVLFNIAPFIKKMIFYYPEELLKKLILVDLPGLYDDAFYRVQKTKDYLENETDFIMVVVDNIRASSDAFIDNCLNNHLINIIVKKRIPDILLAITKIDAMYDMDDFDEDEYNEDEIHEKLDRTDYKLRKKINENQLLNQFNINPDNINIQFCSIKKEVNEKLDTINTLKTSMEEIADKRMNRYTETIKTLLHKYYTYLLEYVKKDKIEEEEQKKIKNIIKTILENMSQHIIIEFNKDIVITNEHFNQIYLDYERYEKKLNDEIHGRTTTCVLQKLHHESSAGDIFNLIEDLSVNYKKYWLTYIETIGYNYNNECENHKNYIRESNLFNELYQINGLTIERIEKLKKDILSLSIPFDQETFISNQRISYMKYFEISGNDKITEKINNIVCPYRYRSRLLEGTGTCQFCRGFIKEMLSYENSIETKEKINSELLQFIHYSEKDKNDKMIYNLENCMNRFSALMNDNKINLDEIKEELNKINITRHLLC